MPLRFVGSTIIRRIALYLGLAFGFLTIIGLVAAVIVHTGLAISSRWVALATFTGVLIAATVRSSRKYWRFIAFWFILSGLLCLHLVIFILILRNFPDFRLVWYVPVVILEAGIFGSVYDLLLADTSRRSRV